MKISKILIGVDDSKYAENAAKYGFDIAQKFNASVGLLNIVEPIVLPDATPGIDPLMTTPMVGTSIEGMEMMDIQKNQSENIVGRTAEKYAGDIEITQFTNYGSRAEGIIECSKEFGADLIVIGTHERSGFDRLLMGSVAEHVVRYSDVPVLVVPFRESESQ